MTVNTHRIESFPKHRLDYARDALAKAWARLERAARKAGQIAPAAPELTVVAERIESRCNACQCVTAGYAGGTCLACRHGYLVSRAVVDLDLLAERPALAGWDFLAVVEPLAGGNLIKQVPCAAVADGELTPWRTADIRCDHCGTARRRTETFIVRADGSDAAVAAGTYKQVGRNCLEAFLGGKSAAAIIAMIGWPEIVRIAGDDGEGGWGRDAAVIDPESFLCWTAAVIRIDGWLSRTVAREACKQATADTALHLLCGPLSPALAEARETYRPTDEDRQRAAAALAWARALDGVSDYEQNLTLVARQEMLDPKHAGILASAIASHTRALGREMERKVRAAKAADSKHVGEVGKRLDLELTIERVVPLTSDWGALNIITFRDAAGNAIVWKTGAAGGTPGDVVKLRGTVKKHTEYKGELQTELTRCTISERKLAVAATQATA
jgi:hypothetical protein